MCVGTIKVISAFLLSYQSKQNKVWCATDKKSAQIPNLSDVYLTLSKATISLYITHFTFQCVQGLTQFKQLLGGLQGSFYVPLLVDGVADVVE